MVAAAVERARSGGGPHVVEALTYRLCDHTTSDDAGRYRDDAEVSRRWPEEPLLRLRAHLTAAGRWNREAEEHLLSELAAEIDAAADRYLATPPQDPASIFDYAFDRLPDELAEQRAAALAGLTEG